MTLKQLMQSHQVTIKDLVKLTKYSHKRLNEIVNNNAQPSIHEKNHILNALIKLKINPLDMHF